MKWLSANDLKSAAADVGRMTVFNHFARKEDMFFDRDEQCREILREALRQPDTRDAPIETLRLLAHRLVAEQSPFVEFTAASQGFIETIERSETLKARARAIRDELSQVVTVALSERVGREPTDSVAHLAAGLLLATWTVAIVEAHRIFRLSLDAEEAKAAFLAIVDKGTIGLKAAMAGTPYACAVSFCLLSFEHPGVCLSSTASDERNTLDISLRRPAVSGAAVIQYL